ncbi:MAG TPA: hypothetical protein V6C72_02280 [Chroococcales cyanobacterium]
MKSAIKNTAVIDAAVDAPVVIQTRGLFQIKKIAEQTWSCVPVLYGTNVVFAALELKVEQIDQLLTACKVPTLSFVEDSYVVEYFDGMDADELVKFGFNRA